MRKRNIAGSSVEEQALGYLHTVYTGYDDWGLGAEPLPDQCKRYASRKRFPLGLQCEILDAYDQARMLGATGAAICRELHLAGGTSLISRWRQRRTDLMHKLDILFER